LNRTSNIFSLLVLFTRCQSFEETFIFLFEFFKSSFLDEFTRFKNKNLITILNCTESMSNCDGCAHFHDVFKGNLDFILALFIQSTCRLVKNENLWLSYDTPSNGKSLLLATGELASFDTALNIESRGKTLTFVFLLSGIDISNYVLKVTFLLLKLDDFL